MKFSAGLLMYRVTDEKPEFFLVHPGGPFFKNKDDGYWSIPKGLIEENEDKFTAAVREFTEETGIAPCGDFIPLGWVKQSGIKTVYAWAFKQDEKCDLSTQKSNMCEMEWPPCSGKKIEIPEVDKGEFFSASAAKKKIKTVQFKFIERLLDHLKS